MELTFQMTEPDFRDAFLAHRQAGLGRRWFFRLLTVGIVILFVVACVSLVPNSKTDFSAKLAQSIPSFFLALMWAAIIWLAPYRAARSQFRKQPGVQGQRRMVVDEEGVLWITQTAEAKLRWENYLKWFENDKSVLLYSSPAAFTFVPKRCLSSEQLHELRELLRSHVKESK